MRCSSGLGASFALAACMLACGGSPEGATPSTGNASLSCAYRGQLPTGPSTPPGTSTLRSGAEANWFQQIDGFMAPYLTGRIPVYRGTLSAHDNQGVLGIRVSGGAKLHDESVPISAALATLDVQKGVASLSVFSTPEHKHIVLSQTKSDSAQTTLSIILTDTEQGGNSVSCKGCVPVFLDRPASIDFSDVEASELIGLSGGGGATLRVTATASLRRLPPCELTLQDLAVIGLPAGFHWVETGGDWVATEEGSGYDSNGCWVDYTVDVWVSSSDLAKYGVRNFVIQSGAQCRSGSP